jgi:hypothetical protein
MRSHPLGVDGVRPCDWTLEVVAGHVQRYRRSVSGHQTLVVGPVRRDINIVDGSEWALAAGGHSQFMASLSCVQFRVLP